MKLEITSDQLNQIQDEIIRLEEYLADNRDTMSPWEFISVNDKISAFKVILEEGEIDLNNSIY